MKTKVSNQQSPGVSKVASLKLPFERDESAADLVDSGGAAIVTPPPSEAMKQAVRDIARGVQDTDRGAVVGRTYPSMTREVGNKDGSNR